MVDEICSLLKFVLMAAILFLAYGQKSIAFRPLGSMKKVRYLRLIEEMVLKISRAFTLYYTAHIFKPCTCIAFNSTSILKGQWEQS